MAHQIAPLYNLKGSVGKGGNNFSQDVRLAEALLKILFDNSGDKFWKEWASRSKRSYPKTALQVTGNYHSSLDEWIDLILSFYNSAGFNLTMDAKLDPLPEPHPGNVDTHAGPKPRNFYVLCTQAMASNFKSYLFIGDTQKLMWAIIPGGHVSR